MYSSPNMTIITYELLCLFVFHKLKLRFCFLPLLIYCFLLICIQEILLAHVPDIIGKNSNELFGQPNTKLSKTSDLHLLKVYYSTEFGE